MATGERFRPRGQEELAPSGQVSRIAANVAAIRTLRKIQAGQRPATPGEQAFLARWSGWGAVPQVFDEQNAEFAGERDELRALLSDAEYAAARRTTINAHYTGAGLVRAIWDGVQQLGFTGGQVLEPGCGSGNFIGFAPQSAQVLGVELDPVTAGIAAALYPDAQIRNESFADTRLPDGIFDLVIGNVPFSAARLHDPRHNAAGHSMHNHFIVKSLRLTRPGGLVAVLTSRYTMDAQDSSARKEMAGLADLVTAVRLPGGAHRRAAGTDAVTDLLVLRRRGGGRAAPVAGSESWERSVQVDLPGGTVWVSEYFHRLPGQALGTFEVGGGQYSATELLVRPAGELAGVPDQLDSALSRAAATTADPAPQVVSAREADRFEGTLTANEDGSFSVLRDGQPQPWQCPKTQARELRALLALRDTVAELLDAEAASAEDTLHIGALRSALNRRYDACVAAHGPLNRAGWQRTGHAEPAGDDAWTRKMPAQGGFRQDPYAATVYALEDYDPDSGHAGKAAIFTGRVIAPRQAPASADSPADAVAICLDATGEVRLDVVARLLGAPSPEDARTTLGELVYDEPGTDRLVPAAEYLSGKVRIKLAEAEQAADGDPLFAVNAAALRRVLPADLGPGEIDARLGAAWIGPEHVQQGLREILEDPGLTVTKGHGATWKAEGNAGSVLATEIWGTQERDALSLAASLLEQRPIRVSPVRSDADDPPHVRRQRQLEAATATVAARAKADELSNRFTDWLWEDPQRSAELASTYNERFNSLVLRSYDGVRLSLPGLAASFRPRLHQVAAVARIISEPAVLLAHEVGAGKTAEMVMGAMELRRLGMAVKPAIMVPNHMLEQFQREFMQLYPQASVLAAGRKDLERLGRQAFVARIATGNWDAVIMSRSVFGHIPMSAAAQEEYLAAQLAEYDTWLERARAAGVNHSIVKKMETRRLMREERLKRKLAITRDAGICWEQTGIDYLFVDEAHAFKNLDTRSNNRDLGIDGSGRASDLDMKLCYLRRVHGRRVATFATATPIANSMSEGYVMTMYLRPDLLAGAGIEDFDGWAGTFAETTTDVEVAPEGGIRVKDRFARFRNVPELLRMWHVAADVKTGEDLRLPAPDLAGGRPEVVTVESSGGLRAFMDQIVSRAEAVRTRAVLPDEDNMLKISSDGRSAALDLRLVGMQPPEVGKLDVAAEHIAGVWEEHREDIYQDADGHDAPVRGSLQIVFCDLGTPSADARKAGKWIAYEYLREQLAARGVPAAQVRFMHEAKTDKEKAELFAFSRAGKIAVLIGSTELMGVGTNVQDRAIALHHLDCPWRPADVTQREGRILRQGNRNAGVRILRYVTEGSFDAYMWQTVTRKAKFIAQVMRGRLDAREIEDVGAATLSYSEVTALASGDMRILAKAQADADVQRLERLHASWRRSQYSLKTRASQGERQVTDLTERVAQIDAAIGRRQDTRGDAFTMNLGGREFTRRADAAGHLQRVARQQADGQRGRGIEAVRRELGTFGGFPLTCTTTEFLGVVTVTLSLHGSPSGKVQISSIDLQPDKPPLGLIARLENRLSGLDQERKATTEEITRVRAEADRAQAGLGAPFAKADELARARAAADRLAEELSGGAPASSGVAVASPETTVPAASPASSPAPERDVSQPPHAAAQGRRPTAEQQAIIDACVSGQNLVIEAGAGTGKTSTLRMASDAMRGRTGLYVAYNKAIAVEAQGSFPPNVTCSTAHSLAFRATGRNYSHRLPPSSRRLPARDIAIMLGIHEPLRLDDLTMFAPPQLARLVMTTVDRFCQSADTRIGDAHVPAVNGVDAAAHAQLSRWALPLADRAWDDIQCPDGRLPFSHDHYLKMWQLTSPAVPADFILFDEAQDANPVTAAIIQGQDSAQKIAVGDSCQAIYGWRGAVDALATWPADTRLFLSQSFRFGDAVAAEANKWLGNLGARLRLSGTPAITSTIGPADPADVVLCRTNAEAVSQVITALEAGRSVAMVGGGDDFKRLATAAVDLMDKGHTSHPELMAFRTWADVQDYARNDESGADLATFVRLIDDHGPLAVLSAASALSSEDRAEVTISTAHKAKGREWDRVRIATDFREPRPNKHTGEPGTIPRPDAMLAYVAVTRARHRLDRKGLAWIDNYAGQEAYDSAASSTSAALEQETATVTPSPDAAIAGAPDRRTESPAPAPDREPAVISPPAATPANTPETESASITTIRIEHDHSGTRVYGTDKNDLAVHQALRDTSFKWSRRQSYWYLPRPWKYHTRTLQVNALAENLTRIGRTHVRADGAQPELNPAPSAQQVAETPAEQAVPPLADDTATASTSPGANDAPAETDGEQATLFDVEPDQTTRRDSPAVPEVKAPRPATAADNGELAEGEPYTGGRAQAESGSRIIENNYLAWTQSRAAEVARREPQQQGRMHQLATAWQRVSARGLGDGPGPAAVDYHVLAHAAHAVAESLDMAVRLSELGPLVRLAQDAGKHAERLRATAGHAFLRSPRAGPYTGGRGQAESGSRIIENDYLTWTRTEAAARIARSAIRAKGFARMRSAWTAIRDRGLDDGPGPAADRYTALTHAARHLTERFEHDYPSADLIPLLELTDHATRHATRLRATADAHTAQREARTKERAQAQGRPAGHESNSPATDSYQGLPVQVSAVTRRAHSESGTAADHNGRPLVRYVDVHNDHRHTHTAAERGR